MTPDLLADRYELTARLAGGGMGQVWRGRDRVLQRIVAIKTVDLSGQDQSAKERFRREAVATAGLSTPQVVQVYDAGFDGDTAVLVMELLTGPSLSGLIHSEGPLPVPEALRVALEVTRGLLAAHRIGVVHRDIKPGNVMFNRSDREGGPREDEIKLVDFGIAQLSENAGATLTAPATALGTAAYMSPEQASGRGATAASDWYALGCLLTTMLTGRPPFTGEALAVANQQINAQPPRLRDRRPDVSPAFDELVARLLDKDPARRPTGEQVLQQLRSLAADPGAPTVLAAAPVPPATAVLPGRTPTRASFAETPSEPDPYPESRPVPVPAAPPAGSRPYQPPVGPRQKSRWPWLVVVLMLLASGIAAAVSLLPGLTLPGGAATPSPTPTPTRAETTTSRQTQEPTRAQTTGTTRPSTQEPTQAPTTRSQQTQQPTSQATGNSGSGNSGSGNSGSGNSGSGNSGSSGGSNNGRGNGGGNGNSNSNGNSGTGNSSNGDG